MAEAEAQKLQDALGADIAVYLGSEWLVKQPQIPHVIVIPGNAEYRPPSGDRAGQLAAVQLQETYLCRAMTFEEAMELADLCYTVLAPGQIASSRLSTEVWGDYNVRTAALTITYPASLSRQDIARVRIKTFTQLAHFIKPSINPSAQEVPDDHENETTPTGITEFIV